MYNIEIIRDNNYNRSVNIRANVVDELILNS